MPRGVHHTRGARGAHAAPIANDARSANLGGARRSSRGGSTSPEAIHAPLYDLVSSRQMSEILVAHFPRIRDTARLQQIAASRDHESAYDTLAVLARRVMIWTFTSRRREACPCPVLRRDNGAPAHRTQACAQALAPCCFLISSIRLAQSVTASRPNCEFRSAERARRPAGLECLTRIRSRTGASARMDMPVTNGHHVANATC